MLARYLITFSYIGSRFRGSQRQIWSRDCNETVQGVFHTALENLKPSIVLQSQFAGRTDSGVHALCAAAHVDLPTWRGKFLSPDIVTINLNRYFCYNQIEIAVRKTRRVHPEFNARRDAISRTYLYRLVHAKPGAFENIPFRNLPFPIEEFQRSHLLRGTDFNVEKAREALKLFEGTHDFETFKKAPKKLKDWSHSIRTLYSVDITEGKPMCTSHSLEGADKFQFWDITFRGRSFVYNQVRRMVGAAIAVATDRIPLKEITLMLQVPSKNSWPSRAEKVPPHGLYLCNVEYRDEDLNFVEDTTEYCTEPY